VHGEDASPLVHPTCGKLYYLLIFFSKIVFLFVGLSKVKKKIILSKEFFILSNKNLTILKLQKIM